MRLVLYIVMLRIKIVNAIELNLRISLSVSRCFVNETHLKLLFLFSCVNFFSSFFLLFLFVLNHLRCRKRRGSEFSHWEFNLCGIWTIHTFQSVITFPASSKYVLNGLPFILPHEHLCSSHLILCMFSIVPKQSKLAWWGNHTRNMLESVVHSNGKYFTFCINNNNKNK